MEAETYLRFVLALVFVVGLIGGLAWVARRFGLGGQLAANTGRPRRLSIVEVAPLDGRRKLVLLRRDGVEHLVVLGQNREVVVETGIPAPAGRAPAPRGEEPA